MGKIVQTDDFENQIKSLRKKWVLKSKSNQNQNNFLKIGKRIILSQGFIAVKRMLTNCYHLILISNSSNIKFIINVSVDSEYLLFK